MAKVFAILAENPQGGTPTVVGVADPDGFADLKSQWDDLRVKSAGCPTTVRAWLLSDTQIPQTTSIDPGLVTKPARRKPE